MHALSTNVRTRRLLVVDDDVDTADTLRTLFELNGDHAMAAHSGATALELAKAVRPDVILCDLGMARLDAAAFARAVRADPKLRDVRLVAMAAPGSVAGPAAAGFDAELPKPAPWTEICRTLERLAGV